MTIINESNVPVFANIASIFRRDLDANIYFKLNNGDLQKIDKEDDVYKIQFVESILPFSNYVDYTGENLRIVKWTNQEFFFLLGEPSRIISGGGKGISGFSGYSGFSGFSGQNGQAASSGFSGFSGFSGESGFSGFSGESGFSGFSGFDGITGQSGFSGYSGFSGESGFSGFSGQSGFSGFSGEIGQSGFSGISGYSGFSGFSGESGFSGISGFSGFSGFSGISGFSGVSGFSGTANSLMSSLYAGLGLVALITNYGSFSGNLINAVEANVRLIMPLGGTLSNFYVITATAQPITGSLVIRIRKNAANTAIVITIAAGSAAGTFSDLVNTATFAQGDAITVSFTNNAGLTSALLTSMSVKISS